MCVCVSLSVRGHVTTVWFNLHMRDGAKHYKLYLLKLTMAENNFVFMIIKGAF